VPDDIAPGRSASPSRRASTLAGVGVAVLAVALVACGHEAPTRDVSAATPLAPTPWPTSAPAGPSGPAVPTTGRATPAPVTAVRPASATTVRSAPLPRTAQQAAAKPSPRPAPRPAPAPAAGGCDPNYTPCVPIASDVDCAGGKGNGPAYVQGPVRVIGKDIYGLDADKDGIGCE
jgi:hypothetical protein